jgi:methyltransferase (TIGR00027 family)
VAEPLIRGVPDTAFMVAGWRADETARPDALFHDPYAARLAGEHGKAIVASMSGFSLGRWSVAVRTVLIDELVGKTIAAGADVVLNLGAGLDARPYRMDLPADVRWIEVDYPHVIELKEARLADERPRCRLERIKLDLANVPARRARLAEIAAQSRRILVLTEGLIPYLSNDDVAALAEDLSGINASAWITDFYSPQTLRFRRQLTHAAQMREAPFRFEPGDWMQFFRRHGWRPREIRYLAVEGRRHGRPAPLPGWVRLVMRARFALGDSSLRARHERGAGYVVLEPAAPARLTPMSAPPPGTSAS